jgi:hypothetical protein
MIWAVLGLLTLWASLTTVLLVRATRRLLQFDDIFGEIVGSLTGYADDLRKMSSGGVLLDHPEVTKFHNRNLKTLKALDAAVKKVEGIRPPAEPTTPLPLPDVE